MKDINDEIRSNEVLLKRVKEDVIEIEKRIEELKSLEQIDTKDLYADITSIVSVKLDIRMHEKILGGDGRSQPWSKKEKGVIANISTSNYYLTEKQRDIVLNYVKATHEADSYILPE